MYNTKIAILMEVIKVLVSEDVHYSLPTMKSKDDGAGSYATPQTTFSPENL
jgi:hypothetical protein